MLYLLRRAVLVAAGLVAGLALAEGLARLLDTEAEYGGAKEKLEFREGGRRTARVYTIDPEIGFRPILGTGHLYTASGTLRNDYPLEKRAGIERLLFVGDSVTAQGLLVNHLKQSYGERRFEYWNAGVHSFNTVQEVKYYARYNSSIRPDRVILTFHNNDFETTPVAFTDGDGRLVVYSPSRTMSGAGRWLFRHSQLYRLALGVAARGRSVDAGIARETHDALADLKSMLARDRVRFSVVLLPIMKPYAAWSAEEKRSRALSLQIFRDLHLRYVDLMPALDAALAVTPSTYTDSWHPADAAAATFAEYLVACGLLGPEETESRCEAAPGG